jgi:DNA-directed RNA polymerase specialized sigma subunit
MAACPPPYQHVSRSLKEQALRLCRAADELHQRLGRSPTILELAEELGLGEEEVSEALAAVTSRQEVSLDQPAGDEAGLPLGELVAAPEAREEPEDLFALSGMVAALPELEREVIVLRFFQGLDQDTIAARVGYFQMTSRGCSAGPWPACARSWWNPDRAKEVAMQVSGGWCWSSWEWPSAGSWGSR